MRLVIEEFPREQEDLELTIGRKFVGALLHFEDISLMDLSRGDEPADLMCCTNTGETVAIQVVEAINQQLRELQSMRSSYRTAVVTALGEDLLKFNGCRVSLVDSGDPPYLPKVDTAAGQACLTPLLDHIRDVAEGVQSLPEGKMRLRSINIGLSARKIGVLAERIASPSEPPRLEFTWSGAGPGYRAGESRGILTAAVRSKLEKHYAHPAEWRFILLAYSVDTLLTADDPDLSEAQLLLRTRGGPFDEVWYFYPYAEKTLGHLIRVWPNETDG